MFCYKCGKQLPDDAVFCGGCGTRQPEAEVAPAPQPQPVAPPQPQPEVQPQPAPAPQPVPQPGVAVAVAPATSTWDKKKKQMLVWILVAVFAVSAACGLTVAFVTGAFDKDGSSAADSDPVNPQFQALLDRFGLTYTPPTVSSLTMETFAYVEDQFLYIYTLGYKADVVTFIEACRVVSDTEVLEEDELAEVNAYIREMNQELMPYGASVEAEIGTAYKMTRYTLTGLDDGEKLYRIRRTGHIEGLPYGDDRFGRQLIYYSTFSAYLLEDGAVQR